MTDDLADQQDVALDADEPADECGPAADGILRCLQMLADEAAALRLPHTLEALQNAMAACAVEAAEIAEASRGLAGTERPAATTLH